MNNCHHIGSEPIDFTVNREFNIRLLPIGPNRFSIQIELDDIASGDQFRRTRAREQKMIRLMWMANAHMTVCIEHVLVRKDVVGINEVRDECDDRRQELLLVAGGARTSLAERLLSFVFRSVSAPPKRFSIRVRHVTICFRAPGRDFCESLLHPNGLAIYPKTPSGPSQELEEMTSPDPQVLIVGAGNFPVDAGSLDRLNVATRTFLSPPDGPCSENEREALHALTGRMYVTDNLRRPFAHPEKAPWAMQKVCKQK